MIGEGAGTMGKALDEMSVDQKDGEKEKPEEEMSKLVEEVSYLFVSLDVVRWRD